MAGDRGGTGGFVLRRARPRGVRWKVNASAPVPASGPVAAYPRAVWRTGRLVSAGAVEPGVDAAVCAAGSTDPVAAMPDAGGGEEVVRNRQPMTARVWVSVLAGQFQGRSSTSLLAGCPFAMRSMMLAAIELGGLEHGVEDGGALAAGLGAEEHVVFARDGDAAQRRDCCRCRALVAAPGINSVVHGQPQRGGILRNEER